jgi:hypothetical protein
VSEVDKVWLNAMNQADVAGEQAALEREETMLKLEGYEPFPICGFAWVTVKPGNCVFANWLKKKGHARKAYGGGVQIWISGYGQSHDKKEAYAHAFANKLKELLIDTGIVFSKMTVSSGSRLD